MSDLQSRRRRIAVDGQVAVYADVGPAAGRVVVVLASMLVRDKSYGPLADELTRIGWRVVVVEMPGVGRSSKVKWPWSMEQYADWLGHFLDALRLPAPPVLVGHSNSAVPAALLCARAPERVAGLVLTDAVGADGRRSLPLVLLGRAVDAVIEWRLTLWGFHHAAYNLVFHTLNCLRQIWLAARSDLRPVAPRVTAPTLIAWGRRDHTTLPAGAEVLQELMPHATTYVSPTGSHDWLITHADEFARAFDAFAAEPLPLRRRASAGDEASGSGNQTRRTAPPLAAGGRGRTWRGGSRR